RYRSWSGRSDRSFFQRHRCREGIPPLYTSPRAFGKILETSRETVSPSIQDRLPERRCAWSRLQRASCLVNEGDLRRERQERRGAQVVADIGNTVAGREVRRDIRCERPAKDPREVERHGCARVADGGREELGEGRAERSVRESHEREAEREERGRLHGAVRSEERRK